MAFSTGVRKVRKDCTVGTFERTRGLPPGTVRNTNGRDTRSENLIGTIWKDTDGLTKKVFGRCHVCGRRTLMTTIPRYQLCPNCRFVKV